MKMYKYSCFYFLLCLLVYFIVLNCLEIILKKKNQNGIFTTLVYEISGK